MIQEETESCASLVHLLECSPDSEVTFDGCWVISVQCPHTSEETTTTADTSLNRRAERLTGLVAELASYSRSSLSKTGSKYIGVAE